MSAVNEKLLGKCSVCLGSFRLQADGILYRHGKRDRPCSGSGSVPCSGSITERPSNQSRSSQATGVARSQSNISSQDMFVASQGNSSDNGTPSQFAAFDHPPRLGPVIKRIPKSARKVCAQLLSSLISDVVCNVDSAEKWNNLMNFSTQILLKPKRGGKRRNLCKLISDRVSKWPRGLVEEKSTAGCRVASRNLSSDQILAKAVMAKIEDGNIRAAVRIICSDDSPAKDSPETSWCIDRQASSGANGLPHPA